MLDEMLKRNVSKFATYLFGIRKAVKLNMYVASNEIKTLQRFLYSKYMANCEVIKTSTSLFHQA